MKSLAPVVFLLDVDNTLLDNDRVIVDLKTHLAKVFGPESQQRYWRIFEEHRAELGYADYLGTLQRFRLENLHNPNFFQAALYLTDYPFADCVYPRVFELIEHLKRLGQTVILSDGDVAP